MTTLMSPDSIPAKRSTDLAGGSFFVVAAGVADQAATGREIVSARQLRFFKRWDFMRDRRAVGLAKPPLSKTGIASCCSGYGPSVRPVRLPPHLWDAKERVSF